MEKTVNAIILIVLGLIVLAFPLLGIIPAALITGFIIIIFGLGLMITGNSDMDKSMGTGLIELIFGILALVLGIGIIANPGLFAVFLGFIVFIVGFFLVIAGLMVLFTKADDQKWNGIITIIVGIIYIIIGNFVSNPIYLGMLIGLWLIIMGIMVFFQKDK
jgi:membrane protein HdeD